MDVYRSEGIQISEKKKHVTVSWGAGWGIEAGDLAAACDRKGPALDGNDRRTRKAEANDENLRSKKLYSDFSGKG